MHGYPLEFTPKGQRTHRSTSTSPASNAARKSSSHFLASPGFARRGAVVMPQPSHLRPPRPPQQGSPLSAVAWRYRSSLTLPSLVAPSVCDGTPCPPTVGRRRYCPLLRSLSASDPYGGLSPLLQPRSSVAVSTLPLQGE